MANFYGLPLQPRPDRYTGHPRPRYPASRARIKKKGKALIRPDGPPGYGPALEWHYTSRWDSASFVLMILAVFSLPFIIGNRGFGWLAHPGFWVTYFVLVFLAWLDGDSVTSSVGADWYRRGKDWVDTYNLREIKGHPGGNGYRFTLIDSENRRVTSGSTALMENAAWALILNGIEHSVAHGAHIDRKAEKRLAPQAGSSRKRHR